MKKLSIHTLMHVPFEGLGCIEQWILKNGHSLSYTHFYENYQLPNTDDIDWLIVMGGPMGVYDEAQYPWLIVEKGFIKKAIDNGKTVIGICLGSQLIAEVLGAKVYPNKQKEIGWFDVKLSDSANLNPMVDNFESSFPVFHWHGDTFDLPTGCIRLFYSDLTVNQGFIYNNRVLALQFHFEVTLKSLNNMVENGVDELHPSVGIQRASEILYHQDLIDANHQKLFKILDQLAADERTE